MSRAAYVDPTAAAGEDWACVDVEPSYALAKPVTLSTVKADPRFREWELVRIGRLSVMPVPAEVWLWVHELAETPLPAGTAIADASKGEATSESKGAEDGGAAAESDAKNSRRKKGRTK